MSVAQLQEGKTEFEGLSQETQQTMMNIRTELIGKLKDTIPKAYDLALKETKDPKKAYLIVIYIFRGLCNPATIRKNIQDPNAKNQEMKELGKKSNLSQQPKFAQLREEKHTKKLEEKIREDLKLKPDEEILHTVVLQPPTLVKKMMVDMMTRNEPIYLMVHLKGLDGTVVDYLDKATFEKMKRDKAGAASPAL